MAATVSALLATGRTSWSFEFFPARTAEDEAVLWDAIRRLEQLHPTFVSVTYGAGGSTSKATVAVTERIATETTITPLAHLTAVGHSVAELRQLIGAYAGAGVRNILALRGDPPGDPGAVWEPHPQGLRYAQELVSLVRELGDFGVGVAAFPDKHPRADDLDHDADILAAKVRAGAEFAITQMFFDPASYFRLRDRLVARGIDVPLLAGVMPVTNLGQIERFAALSGTVFPARIADRLHAVEGDKAAVRAVGLDVATELCEELLAGGAPGIHLITLNRSTSSREIFQRLAEHDVPLPGAPSGAHHPTPNPVSV